MVYTVQVKHCAIPESRNQPSVFRTVTDYPLFCLQGKIDAAASMIEKAIVANPTYAEAFNNLGVLALSLVVLVMVVLLLVLCALVQFYIRLYTLWILCMICDIGFLIWTFTRFLVVKCHFNCQMVH